MKGRVIDLFAGPGACQCPALVEVYPGRAVLAVPSGNAKLPMGWTHKVCPGCGFIADRAEYGTQSRCRTCRAAASRTDARREYRRAYYAANRDKAIAHAAKWKRRNPERVKDSHRKSKYGIPHGTYARLLEAQGGGCAICGAPEPEDKALHIDHCHTTGRVRGLLCDLCNRGLGYFVDNPDRLRDAAAYLEASRD